MPDVYKRQGVGHAVTPAVQLLLHLHVAQLFTGHILVIALLAQLLFILCAAQGLFIPGLLGHTARLFLAGGFFGRGAAPCLFAQTRFFRRPGRLAALALISIVGFAFGRALLCRHLLFGFGEPPHAGAQILGVTGRQVQRVGQALCGALQIASSQFDLPIHIRQLGTQHGDAAVSYTHLPR